MEGSKSKASKNWQANPYEYEDFVPHFGSLRVGEGGFLKGRSGTNLPEPATQNPEKDVTGNEQTKRSRDQLLVPQETPETSQGFSINSVSNHGNVWGYDNSNNLGESYVSKLNSGSGFLMGSVNFNGNHVDSGDLLENLDGSSSGQRGPNFFCGSSSTSNHVNQYNTVPIQIDAGRNQFENHGLFSPIEYFGLNKNGLWSQNGQYSGTESAYPVSDFYYNAGIRIGSNGLEMGNIQETRFMVLPDFIFWLMRNPRGHVLFDELIDSCVGNELYLVVEKLWSNIELFLETAFCRIGSKSIQKLIKKLKKTPYASIMTKFLSSRYYQMMTHDSARHVIIQCLNVLDRKSNEGNKRDGEVLVFIFSNNYSDVFGEEKNNGAFGWEDCTLLEIILYERTINYFEALARHEVGCRSLNECINSIAGNQRDKLLNRIADLSDFLSNDPYGNYVVQHVLMLRNNLITKKILYRLQDQFIKLSTTKGGSHVVEKCIESSTFGSSLVVKEILDCPITLVRLGQHKFGNYVIQKALLKTKIEGQMHLYEPLVTILEEGEKELKRTVKGNYVLSLLKELQEDK